MTDHKGFKIVLALALCVLASCTQPATETRLLPETREGIFYFDFAAAQAVAQAEGKAILLDMWRPG